MASEVSCIKNKPPSNDTTPSLPSSSRYGGGGTHPRHAAPVLPVASTTDRRRTERRGEAKRPTEVEWEHYDSLGELTLVCTHARHAATYLNHHLVPAPVLFTKLPQDQQATDTVAVSGLCLRGSMKHLMAEIVTVLF